MAVALALGATVSASAADPVFRVGMDTRSPPWSFVPGLDYSAEDANADPRVTEAQLKKATGIDVDVAQFLSQRLGRPLVIVPVAWFDLERALVRGRIDAIVCAWTPGPRTPPEIAASTAYYEWGLLLAARADDAKVTGLGDLKKITVGHFQSQVVERTLRSVGAGALKVYDKQETLFDDLKADKLGAILYDSPYVKWRVARDGSFKTVGETLNRLGYHVGLRRSDAGLAAQVQAAVRELVASGERERIRKKWEEAP
ncbi:MAG TPA: ABC transporter substrate-binding protein [Vicinamibacteria bacterium]|nr:ABC transporter substrate-binding protein [Vicinamibacteria bacterium]